MCDMVLAAYVNAWTVILVLVAVVVVIVFFKTLRVVPQKSAFII